MARGRPRRASITAEQVADAAFRIADAEGLEALSMRRLARSLGVEAASLYHHVTSRDALLDGIVARMRAEIRLPDPIPESWPEATEAIFVAYADVLARHPRLVPLAGRQVPGDPQVDGLTWLVDEGLPVDVAVELWQSIHALTIGFALLASSQVPFENTRLAPAVAARVSQWRLATYRRSLRALLDAFAAPMA